ncbi:MAG: alpha/beta hydrolase [Oscillochloris sp.]|nr:alpha/beta hydrolase [Oscillochloris sp.]
MAARNIGGDLAAQLEQFRASHRLQQLRLAGATWNYLIGGSGSETLVLLPGGPGIADMAFPYILALEQHFRVVAPGYPAEIGSLDRLLAGLDGFIRAHRIERFHLIGASYSGMVVQYLLKSQGSRVRSLLIGDTGVARRERAFVLEMIAACLARTPRLGIQALLTTALFSLLDGNTPEQQFWRNYLRNAIIVATPAELVNRMQVMIDMDRNWSIGTETPLWRGPTLLLESSNDRLFSSREREILRARLPQAEIHTFVGQRHTTALTRAPDYIALMQDFLRRQQMVAGS